MAIANAVLISFLFCLCLSQVEEPIRLESPIFWKNLEPNTGNSYSITVPPNIQDKTHFLIVHAFPPQNEAIGFFPNIYISAVLSLTKITIT